MPEQGSIAKDTVAVCFATVLLVALLLGACVMRPAGTPTAEFIQTAASVPAPVPGPYVF